MSKQNEVIMEKYHGKCGLNPRHLATQIHHIEARSGGGMNDEDNLIPLCDACHEHVHNTGWQNWVERLHKAQARARTILRANIQVGGQ